MTIVQGVIASWLTGAPDLPDDLDEVPLFTAQAVGVALVIGLVIGGTLLGYFLVRRRSIAASAPSLSCGMRELGKQRWRSTFLRLGTHSLDCFSVLGFGKGPLRSWVRGDLEISTPQEATGFVPGLSDPVAIRVEVPGSHEVNEIAIERGAYPALRSWTESGPPRPNSVV